MIVKFIIICKLIIGWFKNKPLQLHFINGVITEKWVKLKKGKKPVCFVFQNSKKTYDNYIAHKLDKPAIKYYYQYSIQVKCEKWYINGKQHRLDKPSEICYFQDGKIKCKKWHVNGQQHRINKPAEISYFQNGNIKCKKWITFGQQHRLNKASEICYFQNGNINCKMWCVHGRSHRVTGPSKIYYNENGNEIYIKWCVSGRGLAMIEVIERTNKIKKKICIILNKLFINSYNYDSNINNIIASYTI